MKTARSMTALIAASVLAMCQGPAAVLAHEVNESVGVSPDVAVPADSARDEAVRLSTTCGRSAENRS